MTDQPLTDELIRRIIFVKVDHTLNAPEHPSIAAAAAEIYRRVEIALAKPSCALCSLGFAPFNAEGIMWHQVNGRYPFRCEAP